MKWIILVALIAFAASAPVDDKKDEKKPIEKTEEKKPAADDKKPVEKPEEKKEEERRGLSWPLPDPINEGDLMLHGFYFFERVGELRKAKLESDMDKMVLAVGRDYLRRVHKYIEKTPEFKILTVLCRDSERMNSTKRWEIRVRPEHQPIPAPAASESQDEKQEKPQSDAPKETKQNDPIVPSNATHENVTEAPISPKFETYEIERVKFYERMGDNFARLLLKRYRKEKLEKEEIDYLDRWLNEESVHYGLMGIYCRDGENVKEITKRIVTFIDEKQ